VAAVLTVLLKGATLPGLSRLALRTEVQGTAHGVSEGAGPGCASSLARPLAAPKPGAASRRAEASPAGSASVPAGLAATDEAKEASAAKSLAALAGQAAEAETALRPAGKIRLGGATYDAVSEGGYIEAGTKVVVLRISSGNLVVRASSQAG
jgi:hypothetical protein